MGAERWRGGRGGATLGRGKGGGWMVGGATLGSVEGLAGGDDDRVSGEGKLGGGVLGCGAGGGWTVGTTTLGKPVDTFGGFENNDCSWCKS